MSDQASQSGTTQINAPVSVQCDATGAGSVALTFLLTNAFSVWTLVLSGSGSGTANVLVDGDTPGGSVPIVNGGAIIGPVYSYGRGTTTVKITGALPGSLFTGNVNGSSSYDPQDYQPPSTSNVGISQLDPTQLLVGAVGAPLLSQASTGTIAGFGFWDSATFDIGGYAGLYLDISPSAGFQFEIVVTWLDANGNPIIDTTYPFADREVVDVISSLGRQVQVRITAVTVSSGFANVTLIPVAVIPPDPASLFADYGGTTTAKWLIADGGVSIPGSGGSHTYAPACVWPHHVYLQFYTDPANTVAVTLLANIGPSTTAMIYSWSASFTASLQLPRYPMRVVVTNNGAGSITPLVHMTVGN